MMNKTIAATAISALLFAVACYSPEFGETGGFTCEKDRTCPDGYTCNLSTFTCDKSGGGTEDQGLEPDTTVGDGGPGDMEPPQLACKPLEPLTPIGGGSAFDFGAASQRFGFFYDALENELWATVKDAEDWTAGGFLVAFRNGRGGGKWERQTDRLMVLGAAGAHSDVISFVEERGGAPTQTVIAGYQSAFGLNAWQVLQPLKLVDPQNPMTVHHVGSGGYFPQMVTTTQGVGALHAVLDKETGHSEIFYVTGREDTMFVDPVVLGGQGSGTHGIHLAAVGNPDAALSQGESDLHIAYYARTPEGAFDPHYVARFPVDETDPWGGWGYPYGPFEAGPMTSVLPSRLGFSLAMDGGRAYQAYVYQDTLGAENSESLRFGPVDIPGQPVPFPVPAGQPALAMGGGQGVILAIDEQNIPHLVYRPALEGPWSAPQPLVDPVDSGAHAWPEARMRVLTTESVQGRLRIVAAFINARRQLMVGEFECNGDALPTGL